MTHPDDKPTSSLADKLNHLFTTTAPAGRGPYTGEEAARAITASGIPISGSYIWLLRKGRRDNPTMRHVEGLAKFFGVPPAYFFDDEVTATVDSELALLAAMRDTKVQRVALRTAGLSERSMRSINELIERVRELEGLAEDPPESGSPAGG
ncbi:helix-turn-helix domain-containing protein [Streptomyces subrutilus]|uniref:HTH cro/C1-type domain-containing protein n=1 Tax=Streptomyces subrutilus TaxID=36818 RepID=A0A1E5PNG6_9ACTN|nr:helix-turn-helix domain-containing protein [Streptomyces subrutilus]OEJ30892.1 hypothetical protein BGK67_05605 [Streptomyces subrutilus]